MTDDHFNVVAQIIVINDMKNFVKYSYAFGGTTFLFENPLNLKT